jgi:hypothetical protein
MTGGDLDGSIMSSSAEVHKLKSEYAEAHNIHTQLLRKISAENERHNYALALLNIAEIEVTIGTPSEDVQRNVELARSIFNDMGYSRVVGFCDLVSADLALREEDLLTAMASLQRCLSFIGLGARFRHCDLLFGKIGRYKPLEYCHPKFLICLDNSLFGALIEAKTEIGHLQGAPISGRCASGPK